MVAIRPRLGQPWRADAAGRAHASRRFLGKSDFFV